LADVEFLKIDNDLKQIGQTKKIDPISDFTMPKMLLPL
jgi:hypothetical protein